jgi:hypothetical protein
MRLGRHEAIHVVRDHVASTRALLSRGLVFSILVEVERFANCMRDMLRGMLSSLWLLWHTVVWVAMRRHGHGRTVRCLNLELLVNTRVVLICLCHPSLPRPSSCSPNVSLLLILLSLVAIIRKMEILSTVSWR